MRIFFVLLFMSSVVYSQAQEEKLVLGLEEAQKLAYDNNLKLKDQQLDVEIAKSQVDQTLAQGLPQINGNFDYSWNIVNAFAQRTAGDDTVPPPVMGLDPANFGNYQTLDANGNRVPIEVTNVFDNTNQEILSQAIATNAIGGFFNGLGDAFAATHSANANVSVNQKVFDGVYLLGIEATKVYVELSEVQMAPTKRDIEKAVEKSYYGALVTQENIDIIDKNIENLSALLHETQEIYKAGFAEQLDIDRLALSLSTLRNSKKNLIKIKALNYDVLKNAMNVPLSTEVELTEPIEKFEQYAMSDEAIENMAEAELWPEFQIFEVQEKIQNLDIERLERGKLPKVDAFLNGGYNYQGADFLFVNGFDGWFPNVTAGLTVSVPIFDGNLRKNQIKQKQLEMEKIHLSRENLQTNINIQIQNAMTLFANARADIENQKENIALAEKIYNTTQIKYREGVGSSVELYQAQQDLYSAQQAYINSLYDLLIAKVDLEQALGK